MDDTTKLHVERLALHALAYVDTLSSGELRAVLARYSDLYPSLEAYWLICEAARVAGPGLPRDIAGRRPGIPVRTDSWDERVHYSAWRTARWGQAGKALEVA